MIEFNGRINGKTEKFFWRRYTLFIIKLFMFVAIFLAIYPIISLVTTGSWFILSIYLSVVVLFVLMCILPKSKKQKERYAPTRIYIDGEYIVSVCQAQSTFRLIEDATRLVDCGDFYYIDFGFGRKSMDFVCQKSLLINGTTDEFEALFSSEIIVRKK